VGGPGPDFGTWEFIELIKPCMYHQEASVDLEVHATDGMRRLVSRAAKLYAAHSRC